MRLVELFVRWFGFQRPEVLKARFIARFETRFQRFVLDLHSIPGALPQAIIEVALLALNTYFEFFALRVRRSFRLRTLSNYRW